MIEIKGDYTNILTYYAQMVSLQKRKFFEVHEFTFEYLSHRIVVDADTGKNVQTIDFPSIENVDRISMIKFAISSGKIRNLISISWSSFCIEDSENEKFAKDLIEIIDSSTFRFF